MPLRRGAPMSKCAWVNVLTVCVCTLLGCVNALAQLDTLSKQCRNCRKPVPMTSKVGQNCPYCGALWVAEEQDRPPRVPTAEEMKEAARMQASREYFQKMDSIWGQTDQGELARLAIHAVDAEVRRTAAGRMTDGPLLRKVYAESRDVQVQVLVTWKLHGAVAVEEGTPGDLRAAVSNSVSVKEAAISLGNGILLEMVWCHPGSFMMGSPSEEPARQDGETQHRVTLTRGFWIGKHEVTQEQWGTVMEANPSYCISPSL